LEKVLLFAWRHVLVGLRRVLFRVLFFGRMKGGSLHPA